MTTPNAQGASAPSARQLRIRTLLQELDSTIDAIWATTVVTGSGVSSDIIESSRADDLALGLHCASTILCDNARELFAELIDLFVMEAN